MNPQAIYLRYRELQAYVGWNEEDASRVQAIASLLDPFLPALIDDFYSDRTYAVGVRLTSSCGRVRGVG